MTFSFIEWQCPRVTVVGGRVSAFFIIALSVLFMVFALLPGLSKAVRLGSTSGCQRHPFKDLSFLSSAH
jgi:hypothetical protein